VTERSQLRPDTISLYSESVGQK